MDILRNYYVEQLNGKRQQAQYEIDFVVNTGMEQIYIQSALNVDTKEKMGQETFSLRNIRDSFRKIVILDSNELPWMNDEGITFVGVIPFLLNPLSSLTPLYGD
jgi:predicted AAA+ superfamily ATPase